MEEDETEIDQIHGDKIAGYRREGPQNGARPKELETIKMSNQNTNLIAQNVLKQDHQKT